MHKGTSVDHEYAEINLIHLWAVQIERYKQLFQMEYCDAIRYELCAIVGIFCVIT